MYKKESINEFREKFYDFIKGKDVLFVGHMGPDDDCIASLLGCHYKFGSKIAVSSEKKDRWTYFKDSDKILFVDDVKDLDFDVVVLLDGNEWSRFSKKNAPDKPVLCIDHHFKEEKTLDLEFVDTSYSSTAEIIYDLFYRGEKIESHVCETLLMGVLSDTGNFSFINQEKTSALSMASDLIVQGKIEVQSLQSKYNNLKFETVKYLSVLLNNLTKVKVGNWPCFVYSYIDEDNEFVDEASAMFKNKYTRGLEEVSWGVTIKKKEKGYSYSFRSLPESVNVRLFAEKLGVGGGHDRASGGFYECSNVDEAINLILDFVKNNSFNDFR